MMSASLFATMGALAVAAASPDSSSQHVTLHKVGFPELSVRQRPACGEMNATKSLLKPAYWMHLIRGFHEGSCAAAGYKQFEQTESVQEEPVLPFLHPTANTSFSVYTRDPNALDVVACVTKKCKTQLSGIASSGYTQDVVKCVKPAFGPCAPKAWACLGDSTCRTAVKCMPEIASKCGADVMKVLEDKAESEKIMCIHNCNNSKICVLTKCGKDALACLDGSDKLCHSVLTCPDGLVGCSKDAFKCMFDKSSICHENVKCLAAGAEDCADPAINALTDTSIADLVVCANERCPAVEAMPGDTASDALVAAAEAGVTGLPHYPAQVACMSLHCTGKVINLLKDRDVNALTTCLPEAAETCGPYVWDCLGDTKCLDDFRCWTESLGGATADLWKMLTDGQERKFDEDLFSCVTGCAKEQGHVKQAACLLGKCGLKATHCLGDVNCRKLLLDIPATAARCGPESVRALLDKNSTFSNALRCGTVVSEKCGSKGVELLRDTNIVEILKCNSRCTRHPGSNSSEDLLIVV